ncbi:hypothetical protein E2562_007289 [Oryza meyeriana var. granulata]|uniref:Uncharacterized protein n=1 Tax=Oryza meyeriana var. granulata TaxID=110450 RepID=A0A6G1CFR2_9ORYZ|nr:hypothetical protein E2562_007289 [Oryza meyeriana var. granulata]
MALVWDYGERTGLKGWKGLSWGMVPLLGGAMCACTWHFFYNSESLEVLVALQGALTVIGAKAPVLHLEMLLACGFIMLTLNQDHTLPAVAGWMRLRLRRREIIRRSEGAEMAMVNLKLYLENRCILAENERLREKASALRRENLALRADLCKTSAPAVLPAAGAAAASTR